MKKGKFIVIDGTDGSGKATQVKELVKNLAKKKVRVKTIDFPRYENNFFGKFIGECLVGENGNFVGLNPKIASVLYAADRFESAPEITKWLEKGYVVIADRYVSSNQIHQAGKIEDMRKRRDFLKWLERMEFEIFKLPRPDAIIYLDVPIEITQQLLKKESSREKKKYQKGKVDQVENDRQYLEKSRTSAIKMLKENNHWVMIDCIEKGKMRAIGEISQEILEKVLMIIR